MTLQTGGLLVIVVWSIVTLSSLAQLKGGATSRNDNKKDAKGKHLFTNWYDSKQKSCLGMKYVWTEWTSYVNLDCE